MTGVQHRQEERHHDMAENKRRPNHVVVSAVVTLDFHVGGLHQNAVPDETEEKDEYERSNKCDEKFTPVHERGFKPARSSLSMQKRLLLQAKHVAVANECRLQFAVPVLVRARNFEIENAHAKA